MNELEKALNKLEIEYEKDGKYYKLPNNIDNLRKLCGYSFAMQKELQKRIDKAINYINDRYDGEVFTHTFDKTNVKELLKILRGDSDE